MAAITIPENTKGWPAPILLSSIANGDTITLPTTAPDFIEVLNKDTIAVKLGITTELPTTGTIIGGHYFKSTGSETRNEKVRFPLEREVEYTFLKV